MSLVTEEVVATDVLVVGGGGAAARAALSATEAGAEVRLAVKGRWLASGSTATAFSELLAIAAAMGEEDPRDNPAVHFEDTLRAGRGFVDPRLVRTLAEEAPARVRDLIALGLRLDRRPDGRLRQARSDFATYPRVLRADGVTARNLLRTLARELSRRAVPVDEEVMVTRLLVDERGLAGAVAYDLKARRWVTYRTRALILATGGPHALWRHHVGTRDMTGDGYAMALEAACSLVNMEFVQIGPAVIYPRVILLSGPVWKVHPTLERHDGRSLWADLPPGLDPRVVMDQKAFPYTVSNLSRHLDQLMAQAAETVPSPHGGVWMSLPAGSAETAEALMPKTLRMFRANGLDPFRRPLEVGLVAQCLNGGVLMENADAATALDGLFVAGEVAGGVRGPDRPGGNSLAEGQVFGHRAGLAASRHARLAGPPPVAAAPVPPMPQDAGAVPASEAMATLRDAMTHHCLVMRHAEGLERALEIVDRLDAATQKGALTAADPAEWWTLKHMLTVARAVLTAAYTRRESRSGHYRTDYPERDDLHWTKSVRIRLRNNALAVEDLHWPMENPSKDDAS